MVERALRLWQDRHREGNRVSEMQYKGYAARIEHDDADGLFFGRIAGLRDGMGFHAHTVEDLRAAFHEAVEDYLEICAKIGKAPQKS